MFVSDAPQSLQEHELSATITRNLRARTRTHKKQTHTMFHLTHERLDELLHSQEARQLSAAGRERLEWIAEFVRSGESISETCLKLNIARSTFHRWLDRFDPSDLSTLEEYTHAPHEARTSNVSPEIIAHIRAYREASPLLGKELIREKLLNEHGIDCSSSTIGRVIERECLYFGSTPLHWRKRMMHEKRTQEVRTKATSYEKPIEKDEPAVLEAKSSKLEARSSSSCVCLWCAFWSSHGRGLRRTIGLASLAINIAFLALYLATAAWEHNTTETMRAEVTQYQTSTPNTISSLDGQ